MASRSVIEAQIDSLTKQLNLLDRFPEEDPFEDGALLRFQKTYGKSPVGRKPGRYLFAAVRASGRWFVTGSQPQLQGIEWYELVDFLGEGVDDVWFAPYVVPAFD